jgi:hypothetical protein
MAKQKQKATWVWVQTKQPASPSEAQKAAITAKFAPLVKRLNDELPPLEAPQVRNQCIRVFTKWWRNFFYVMQEYKCPPEGYTAPGFEIGVSRMEFRAEDSFDIAYFRHTGQWWVTDEGLTLDECLKSVEEDPWFQVF